MYSAAINLLMDTRGYDGIYTVSELTNATLKCHSNYIVDAVIRAKFSNFSVYMGNFITFNCFKSNKIGMILSIYG